MAGSNIAPHSSDIMRSSGPVRMQLKSAAGKNLSSDNHGYKNVSLAVFQSNKNIKWLIVTRTSPLFMNRLPIEDDFSKRIFFLWRASATLKCLMSYFLSDNTKFLILQNHGKPMTWKFLFCRLKLKDIFPPLHFRLLGPQKEMPQSLFFPLKLQTLVRDTAAKLVLQIAGFHHCNAFILQSDLHGNFSCYMSVVYKVGFFLVVGNAVILPF